MQRLGIVLALFGLFWLAEPASADWRWAPPKFQKHRVTFTCDSLKCVHDAYVKEKKRYERRIKAHDQKRLKEWKRWTRIYIPQCTWYGESGPGPQFAKFRYTVPNSSGSGAYGKYQFMPGTYYHFAKYSDWSPLDQEIAGHKAYWSQGTSPWQAC